MVRLLPYKALFVASPYRSFNPTMVRLLPWNAHGLKKGLWMFQSHNGAIAARRNALPNRSVPKFQSHNGAIAAHRVSRQCHAVYRFQSHNGAIAAFFEGDMEVG